MIARILIAISIGLGLLSPTEALARKFRIIVEYADAKDPCRTVAGVKRTNKVKTTAKYIRYNTTRRDAIIVYRYKEKKPTCALIYPR